MNILSWNCRGIGGTNFSNMLNDITKEYVVSLIMFLETHAYVQKA